MYNAIVRRINGRSNGDIIVRFLNLWNGFSIVDDGQNVELRLLSCCVVRKASHQTFEF